MLIICPVHGEFYQRPHNHLDGRDCKECGILKRAATRVAEAKAKFIDKARSVHKNCYGYDKVNYEGKDKHVSILCKVHNEYFLKSPANHLKGQGCPKCALKSRADFHRSSTAEFIEKAKLVHENRYTYEKVEYIRAMEHVLVTCPKHGDFAITPTGILSGHGCWQCGGSKPLDVNSFIERANKLHGNRYNYDEVLYVNNKTPVKILCPDHGEFLQTPDAHLVGNGCSRCKNKKEGEIAIYLNERFIVHRQFSLENRFFDFYLPDYNQLIERDGEQHYLENKFFSISLAEQQVIDEEKTILAKDKGFKIARIPYWLDQDEVALEIENILGDDPTYPDIPNLEQAIKKPKPKN